MPEMLGPDAGSIGIQFEGSEAEDWSDAALVIVSNNPYQLKRLSGVGTRPPGSTVRGVVLPID